MISSYGRAWGISLTSARAISSSRAKSASHSLCLRLLKILLILDEVFILFILHFLYSIAFFFYWFLLQSFDRLGIAKSSGSSSLLDGILETACLPAFLHWLLEFSSPSAKISWLIFFLFNFLLQLFHSFLQLLHDLIILLDASIYLFIFSFCSLDICHEFLFHFFHCLRLFIIFAGQFKATLRQLLLSFGYLLLFFLQVGVLILVLFL